MTGDPFADKLKPGPTRELYEGRRQEGASPRSALRFALGRGLSTFDVFEDPQDALAADLVLEGVSLEEAGARASRQVGSVTPLRERTSGPQRTVSERQQLLAAAYLLGGGPDDVDELSEAVARREAKGATFADALAAVERAGRTAPAASKAREGGGGKRPAVPLREPSSAPPKAPQTVEDYKAMGLSEADAKAAARRK